MASSDHSGFMAEPALTPPGGVAVGASVADAGVSFTAAASSGAASLLRPAASTTGSGALPPPAQNLQAARGGRAAAAGRAAPHLMRTGGNTLPAIVLPLASRPLLLPGSRGDYSTNPVAENLTPCSTAEGASRIARSKPHSQRQQQQQARPWHPPLPLPLPTGAGSAAIAAAPVQSPAPSLTTATGDVYAHRAATSAASAAFASAAHLQPAAALSPGVLFPPHVHAAMARIRLAGQGQGNTFYSAADSAPAAASSNWAGAQWMPTGGYLADAALMPMFMGAMMPYAPMLVPALPPRGPGPEPPQSGIAMPAGEGTFPPAAPGAAGFPAIHSGSRPGNGFLWAAAQQQLQMLQMGSMGGWPQPFHPAVSLAAVGHGGYTDGGVEARAAASLDGRQAATASRTRSAAAAMAEGLRAQASQNSSGTAAEAFASGAAAHAAPLTASRARAHLRLSSDAPRFVPAAQRHFFDDPRVVLVLPPSEELFVPSLPLPILEAREPGAAVAAAAGDSRLRVAEFPLSREFEAALASHAAASGGGAPQRTPVVRYPAHPSINAETRAAIAIIADAADPVVTLAPATYARRFTALLAAEEVRLRMDVCTYDLLEQALEPIVQYADTGASGGDDRASEPVPWLEAGWPLRELGSVYADLTVPGAAENQPRLDYGSVVRLRASPDPLGAAPPHDVEAWYRHIEVEGRVLWVKGDQVRVRLPTYAHSHACLECCDSYGDWAASEQAQHGAALAAKSADAGELATAALGAAAGAEHAGVAAVNLNRRLPVATHAEKRCHHAVLCAAHAAAADAAVAVGRCCPLCGMPAAGRSLPTGGLEQGRHRLTPKEAAARAASQAGHVTALQRLRWNVRFEFPFTSFSTRQRPPSRPLLQL
jgi:hypothetical protein